MVRCGQVAFSGQFVAVASSDRFDDVGEVVHPEITVYFRNFLLQFLLVAFGQAAHYEQVVDLSGAFGAREAEDRIHRLLFGVADETACVDDDDFCIGRVRVERDFEIIAA